MKAILADSIEKLNEILAELEREELVAITETREGERSQWTLVYDEKAAYKRRGR